MRERERKREKEEEGCREIEQTILNEAKENRYGRRETG